MPNRIRLQRTRGWRKPPEAVVVARPSRWGNPFLLTRNNREEALRSYRLHVQQRLQCDSTWLDPLRGRDLVCWCGLMNRVTPTCCSNWPMGTHERTEAKPPRAPQAGVRSGRRPRSMQELPDASDRPWQTPTPAYFAKPWATPLRDLCGSYVARA